MRYLIAPMLAMSFLFCISGCKKSDNRDVTVLVSGDKLKIAVGATVFSASLYDNTTAAAFKEALPMTINMGELNGNEKYYDLPNSLPINSTDPGNINNGDLMLYGSKTLVLFYKSFPTSYNYTRLGKIENTSGLSEALGSGSITVTFELE